MQPPLLLALVAACGGASPEHGYAVRDSAGISIAEHADTTAPGWRLADPVTIIGGVGMIRRRI